MNGRDAFVRCALVGGPCAHNIVKVMPAGGGLRSLIWCAARIEPDEDPWPKAWWPYVATRKVDGNGMPVYRFDTSRRPVRHAA